MNGLPAETMSAAQHETIQSRRRAAWTLAEVEQLGKVPDSVLANRTGRTIQEIVAMRESRRIGLSIPFRRWTAREIRLLGRFSDAELSRRLRRTLGDVRLRRGELKIPPFKPRPKFKFWTPAEIKLIGTMPDADLARKLKRTLGSV